MSIRFIRIMIIGITITGIFTGCFRKELPEDDRIPSVEIADIEIELGEIDDSSDQSVNVVPSSELLDTIPLTDKINPLRIKSAFEDKYGYSFLETRQDMTVNIGNPKVDIVDDILPTTYGYFENDASVLIQVNHKLGFHSKNVVRGIIRGDNLEDQILKATFYDMPGLEYIIGMYPDKEANLLSDFNDVLYTEGRKDSFEAVDPKSENPSERVYHYATQLDGDVFIIFDITVTNDEYHLGYTLTDTVYDYLELYVENEIDPLITRYLLSNMFVPEISSDSIGFSKVWNRSKTKLVVDPATGSTELYFQSGEFVSVETEQTLLLEQLRIFASMYGLQGSRDIEHARAVMLEQSSNAAESKMATGNFITTISTPLLDFDFVIDVVKMGTEKNENHEIIENEYTDKANYTITFKNIKYKGN